MFNLTFWQILRAVPLIAYVTLGLFIAILGWCVYLAVAS